MMFKINDDAGLLIQLYSGLKSGETQLPEAKILLESLFPESSSSVSEPVTSKPPVAVPNDDLLDLFLSTPAPQAQTQQTTPPPPSTNTTKPTPAPKAIALAPPPPTPSRVLPPSLRQQPQQTAATPAETLDIFGQPIRPTQPGPASAPPPAQPAVDIFGDPIKPSLPSQSFPEEDPFSSKVSIDDIMSQPTAPAPAAAPAFQQYPQFPQYPSAPSHPVDPFAFSQSPPLSSQVGYPGPHQQSPPPPSLLDPFDNFAGLSQQPPPSYPPAQQPPPQQPPPSNNPFDLF